jgi:predicted dehydrogenase
MNRRSFVSSLAVATAAAATTRLLAADGQPKPRVGLIGCGWYGGVSLDVFCKHVGVDVVSLCDVNQHSLQKTLALVAKYQTNVPQTFVDYREMLKSGAPDIVIVGTPDHWHALPAIAAMQAGADVYLEKPIGVDVLEGEAMVAAARKYGRVVQVNTQRRSNPRYLEAKEKYITSGRLGKIALVEMYSYLGSEGWSAGPVPDAPVPAHLDYEFFAGPAPKVPYKTVIEDRGWRAFMEFGSGPVGNLGVHMLDKVRWLLGLGWPASISSTGGIYVEKASFSNLPDTQRSVFHYPDLDLSWEHRLWGVSPIPQRHWTDQWGARIIGQHGTLNLTSLEYVFTPKGRGPREGVHFCSTSGDLENVNFNQAGTIFGDTEKRHVLDFMAARRDRSRPIADIEEGHISSASCEISLIAQQLGRPVAYDPKSRTVPNDPEATRLLARPYRGPWVHPDPEKV